MKQDVLDDKSIRDFDFLLS